MTHSLRNSAVSATMLVALAVLGTSIAYASEVTGNLNSGGTSSSGTIGGSVGSGSASTVSGTITGGSSTPSGSSSLTGTVNSPAGGSGGGGSGSSRGGGNGPISGSVSNAPSAPSHGQVLGASIGPIARSGVDSEASVGTPNTGAGGNAVMTVITLLLSGILCIGAGFTLFSKRYGIAG